METVKHCLETIETMVCIETFCKFIYLLSSTFSLENNINFSYFKINIYFSAIIYCKRFEDNLSTVLLSLSFEFKKYIRMKTYLTLTFDFIYINIIIIIIF
jgi:hypothetical protein